MLAYNWAEIRFAGHTVTAVRLAIKPGFRGHSMIGIKSTARKESVFIRLAEDPRFFIFREELYCYYNRPLRHKIRMCAHRLDELATPGPLMPLDYGNKQLEKNWCFFERDDTLYTVYHPAGFTSLEFEYRQDTDRFVFKREFSTDGIVWQHGEARGSTPPLFRGGKMTMFFHSWRQENPEDNKHLLRPGNPHPNSQPVKHPCKVYYVGYCEFEPNPPFKVIRHSVRPIELPGFKQYRIVFPSSAVREPDGWRLACGVDDTFSTSIHVTDEQIEESMTMRP